MRQTDVHMVSVMSRYIDAEWLLNFFEPYPNDYKTPLGSLRACVDDAPSIDIVRCKECRHWYRALDESGTIERFNFSKCTKGHSGNGLEFYCADGEREGE